MNTAKKISQNKNKLWAAYKLAPAHLRKEIQVDLKKADLLGHWHDTASKEGYDLRQAKALLRDVFLKHLPQTAEFFNAEAGFTIAHHVANLMNVDSAMVITIQKDGDVLVIGGADFNVDRITKIGIVNKLMLDVNRECIEANQPAPFPDARPIVHPLPLTPHDN